MVVQVVSEYRILVCRMDSEKKWVTSTQKDML